MEYSSVNNPEGFCNALEAASEQMNPNIEDQRQLQIATNRLLIIANQLETARMLLADAIDGRKCDPSWIRPKPLSDKQRREMTIDAYAIIKTILNDLANQ